MFSLSTIIIAGLVSLFVGGIIGFVLSAAFSGKKQTTSTADTSSNTEESLVSYQRDVAEHFVQTTALINTLTESYRDMYEHLASSALKLSTAEISRQLISANNQLPGATNLVIKDVEIQAPRDWAPKIQGAEGALSEGYGLDDSTVKEGEEHAPDADTATEPTKS